MHHKGYIAIKPTGVFAVVKQLFNTKRKKKCLVEPRQSKTYALESIIICLKCEISLAFANANDVSVCLQTEQENDI